LRMRAVPCRLIRRVCDGLRPHRHARARKCRRPQNSSAVEGRPSQSVTKAPTNAHSSIRGCQSDGATPDGVQNPGRKGATSSNRTTLHDARTASKRPAPIQTCAASSKTTRSPRLSLHCPISERRPENRTPSCAYRQPSTPVCSCAWLRPTMPCNPATSCRRRGQ
jgi:hypothetical protein